MSSKGKVLFVLTSQDKFPNGKRRTGWYLAEAAHPYYHLVDAGYQVEFASPKGGKAPVDPLSVTSCAGDEVCTRLLKDETAQEGINNTIPLSKIDPNSYKSIFYVGGHGAVFDFTDNEASINLAQNFWTTGKPVSAICHGQSALVHVKDRSGKPIVSGRDVTSFSNAEEEEAKLADQVPYLLETRLKELGGKYAKNGTNWGPYVAVDGQLITGANPASGDNLGRALVQALGA